MDLSLAVKPGIKQVLLNDLALPPVLLYEVGPGGPLTQRFYPQASRTGIKI